MRPTLCGPSPSSVTSPVRGLTLFVLRFDQITFGGIDVGWQSGLEFDFLHIVRDPYRAGVNRLSSTEGLE